MTLIKQWDDLSDEEKERLKKKMKEIWYEPERIKKTLSLPTIQIIDDPIDLRDPFGLRKGVKEFIPEPKPSIVKVEFPKLKKYRTSAGIIPFIKANPVTVPDDTYSKLLHKHYKEMIEALFNTRPSPLERLMKAMASTPVRDPTFHWWEDREETSDEPDIDLEKLMAVTPHLIMSKDTFDLVTPYNAGFIRGLKGTYPSNERKYNFTSKVWTIQKTETNVRLAKDLVKQHFNLDPQTFTKEGDIQATYDTAVDVTSKYRILGVKPDATPQEIKKAFYRIAKKLHSDVSEADAEFFILAKKAYDTLKDPIKRKRYDLARKLMGGRIEEETGLRLSSRDLTT